MENPNQPNQTAGAPEPTGSQSPDSAQPTVEVASTTPEPTETDSTTAPASTEPNPVPSPSPLQQALGDMVQPATEPTPETPNQGALFALAKGFMMVFSGIFSWIIFPIAVVLILHNFVFQAYHVLGTSMFPTLHDSDYLIVSKVDNTGALIERLFGHNVMYTPHRGQVIVFHFPKDPTKIFVKRVMGLPGDHLVIKDGSITIFNTAHKNGYNPDASYEPKGTATLIDTDEIIPAGNVFVMGDNRTPGGSYDSREWGDLPSSYIIGNAVMRLLPLDSIKIF